MTKPTDTAQGADAVEIHQLEAVGGVGGVGGSADEGHDEVVHAQEGDVAEGPAKLLGVAQDVVVGLFGNEARRGAQSVQGDLGIGHGRERKRLRGRGSGS